MTLLLNLVQCVCLSMFPFLKDKGYGGEGGTNRGVCCQILI